MGIIAAYLALGAGAGLLAGLLGIGGGLIIVPAFYFLFERLALPCELLMHFAVGSSLATVVFTSLTSAYSHHRHGAVRWPAVGALTPGILLGAALGAITADYLPNTVMRTVFGWFEVLVAVQMAWNLKPAAQRDLPGSLAMAGVGGFVGWASTVLGIGGGTLSVPFLLWCNVPIRQAVATSAACGLPIAAMGAAGFAATGWNTDSLPAWTTGYLYWPAIGVVVAGSVLFAPLGARLTHRLPVPILKRAFALVVVIVGIRMLLG